MLKKWPVMNGQYFGKRRNVKSHFHLQASSEIFQLVVYTSIKLKPSVLPKGNCPENIQQTVRGESRGVGGKCRGQNYGLCMN
jgi:hypothetical protein